jgi:hypothetical protein
MFSLTTPEQISRFHILTLRSACKLEALGMRHSSGKRASVQAKALLGMPRGAKLADVVKALDTLLAD